MKPIAGRLFIILILLGVSAYAQKPDLNVQLNRARGTADRAYQNRLYDEAAKLYSDYLEKGRKHSELHLVSGAIGLTKSLFQMERFTDASKVLGSIPGLYKELLKVHPSLPRTLNQDNQLLVTYWSGRLHLVNRDFAKAIQAFETSAQTADRLRRADSLAFKARCLMAQDKWGEAEKSFQKIMTQGTSADERNIGRLGYCETLLWQKKWEVLDPQVKAWWTEVSGGADKWRGEVAMLRIAVLVHKNKPADAVNAYDSEFKGKFVYIRKRRHFETMRLLGQRLAEAKDFDGARSLYGRMLPKLVSDPQRREIILGMGEQAIAHADLVLAKKAEDQAMKWYNLAVDSLSQFLASYKNVALTPKVHYRRGQVYRKLGQMAAAKAKTETKEAEKHLQSAAKQFDLAMKDFGAAINHTMTTESVRYDAMLQVAAHNAEGVKPGEAFAARLKLAIDWYAKAAELKVPKELKAKALMERGDVLERGDVHEEAAHQFKIVANQFTDTTLALRARFRQADALFKGGGSYKDAAVVFGQFLKEAKPNDPMRLKAMLIKGESHRLASEAHSAMRTFQDLAKQSLEAPDNLASRALLHAAEAAIAAELGNDAIAILTQIITDFSKSPQVPMAMYRRIFCHLHFNNDVDSAKKDLGVFFDAKKGNFAKQHTEYAADILLWLGDYFAGRKEYKTAEAYMLRVVKEFGDSQAAPVALYEAAKCAYYQRRFTVATAHLKKLDDEFGNKMSVRTQAQADYLRGDVLTKEGKFKEADAYFAKCSQAVKGRLHYAALARSADMKFSMAGRAGKPDEREKFWAEALAVYTKIYTSEEVPSDFKNKALFRRAQVWKKMREMEKAVKDLTTIFASYEDATLRGEQWDWFYFVRSGLELATYYENNDRLADAIRIYDRLGTAKTSYAAEARRRAAELRKK